MFFFGVYLCLCIFFVCVCSCCKWGVFFFLLFFFKIVFLKRGIRDAMINSTPTGNVLLLPSLGVSISFLRHRTVVSTVSPTELTEASEKYPTEIGHTGGIPTVDSDGIVIARDDSGLRALLQEVLLQQCTLLPYL